MFIGLFVRLFSNTDGEGFQILLIFRVVCLSSMTANYEKKFLFYLNLY